MLPRRTPLANREPSTGGPPHAPVRHAYQTASSALMPQVQTEDELLAPCHGARSSRARVMMVRPNSELVLRHRMRSSSAAWSSSWRSSTACDACSTAAELTEPPDRMYSCVVGSKHRRVLENGRARVDR